MRCTLYSERWWAYRPRIYTLHMILANVKFIPLHISFLMIAASQFIPIMKLEDVCDDSDRNKGTKKS